MSEANLGRRIMMAVSNIGTRIFRFNTALSWVGRVQRQPEPWTTVIQPSDIVIRNARPLHAGFEGASDYIGWTPVEITPAMVGKTLGVFTGIEVKVPGAKTDKDRQEKQDNFLSQVRSAGGIAVKATSEHEALSHIQSFRAAAI